MVCRFRLVKMVLIIAVAIIILLNFYTFVVAYPETYTITPGINSSGTNLAKDFSAYYMGAWRLWNNPAHIYNFGALKDGEPTILPHPEEYKYLPSFLLIISPFLSLNYQQALLAFDIAQFALLPLMAYLLYKLLSNKPLAITLAVMVITLLLPFPTPQTGFSTSYYWQWGEGQAKVFVTFLLLISFYFGSRGRPYLSGIALAFGFFDPRFGLLALPLFIMYNRKNLKAATISLLGSLALTNAMLLYPGMASNFLNMVLASAVTTPLYYYSLIPLITLLSLIIVNIKELGRAFDFRRAHSKSTLDVSRPQEKTKF
jgi:Glycosyltransferase family 87